MESKQATPRGEGKTTPVLKGLIYPHLSRSLWWHHRNLSYLRSLCHALGSPWTSFRLSRTLLPPTYTRHLRQGSRRSFRNPSKTTAWREDAGRLADGSSFTDKERHETYLAVPKPETGRRQHHILEGTAVRPAPKRNTLATHSDFRRHRSENLDARGKVKKYRWEGKKQGHYIGQRDIKEDCIRKQNKKVLIYLATSSHADKVSPRFPFPSTVNARAPQVTSNRRNYYALMDLISLFWLFVPLIRYHCYYHYYCSYYHYSYFSLLLFLLTLIPFLCFQLMQDAIQRGHEFCNISWVNTEICNWYSFLWGL